ncbi:excisionase [Shigella boydii]
MRECKIFPPPIKDGREYLFHVSAKKITPQTTGGLLQRIRNDRTKKKLKHT